MHAQVQLPPDEMTSISRRNMLEATSLWGLDRSDQADLPGDGQYTSPGDGGNVRVYIIDTGVLGTHQDFNGRYKGGYDFVDNDANPTDCNGHGTHCAGTASGTTHGIAKRSDIYGVRVLGCSGSGSYDGVIAGINYVKQAKQSSPSTPMVVRSPLHSSPLLLLSSPVAERHSTWALDPPLHKRRRAPWPHSD